MGLAALLGALGCSSDGGSEKVVDAYPNRRPTLQSPGHALGYVANRLSDSVSVLDLDAGQLIGAAPVGRDPVDTDGPWHVVVEPAAGLAFMAYSYPDSNVSPHAASNGNNGRLGYVAAFELSDFAPRGEVRLDVTPADVALSPDGGTLAVSHYDTLKALAGDSPESRRANVAFVAPAELAAGTATPKRVSACAAPSSIVFGKDDSRLFVACTGDDTLSVIDWRQGQVLASVKAGDFPVNKPYGLSKNESADRLLVTNQVANSVVEFSTQDTPELLSIAHVDGVPAFAEFLAGDAEYIVALQNPDGGARIDAASGNVLVSRSYSTTECERPSAPRRLKNGRWFMVCQGSGYTPGGLVELDPNTLAVSNPIALGLLPERIEVVEP